VIDAAPALPSPQVASSRQVRARELLISRSSLDRRRQPRSSMLHRRSSATHGSGLDPRTTQMGSLGKSANPHRAVP
jgi:hypothetical protein